MALNERLQRFLAEHEIHHELLPHHEAFTAQEVAEAAHISGRHLAKALLVREEGGGYLLVVLPAPCRIDLAALRADAGRRKLSLASEEEIARTFPDCEVGAMSPFGHLYGLRVYVDACFPRTEEFIFYAGNHHEVVRMQYGEYERLARPVVGEYCLHAREKSVNE